MNNVQAEHILNSCKFNIIIEMYINQMLAHVLSHVRLFMTPWTVSTSLLCPWDFSGNNIEVGCHFFLQSIFPTQGSNPHLLHWQADSLPLSHLGSPYKSNNITQNTFGISLFPYKHFPGSI